MSKRILTLAIVYLSQVLPAAFAQLAPLPVPVSDNAVASAKAGKHEGLYSFMGIGAKKTWDSITNRAFVLDLNAGKWSELRPVPGPAGRIGASAISARGQILLLGGYTVDGHGGEITVSDVSVYEPAGQRWYRGTDLPVAVHDAVVGVYRDRYLYVVGGGSRRDAVSNVQVYDIEKDKWQPATAIPGAAVFGHAGGVLDDTIVYVDGVHRNAEGSYVASDECWIGKIDHKDIAKIQWTKLPEHPGTARYRIAAGASEKEHKIYFSGGSDTPYNYNGIGYDGHPAEPSAVTFAFDARSGQWQTVNEDTPDPTMDHRGLLVTREGLVLVGGMEKGQQVTDNLKVIPRK
ncbi:MAG: kelch repeat-containing protein [Terriglobales bacterium]